MSRRRGEFEHRTSIFEGAFRAWSHLGGLDPEELELKPATELDPLANPIKEDPRENTESRNGNNTTNSNDLNDPDGSTRRLFPYEPLPRSGLAHPYVQAILSPWLGPDADHDAIQLGLTTLRTWWQHRRKGESGSAIAALGTDKMRGVVEGYTRHFFNLAHCLVVNDKEQPPRTLHGKIKELEKIRNKRNKKRAREEQAGKLAALALNAGIAHGFNPNEDAASTSITSVGSASGADIANKSNAHDHLTPLERLHQEQRRQLAESGGIRLKSDINNVHVHSPLVGLKGKIIPGKNDLPSAVNANAIAINHHANQLAHHGGTSGPTLTPNAVTSSGKEYGDPNSTPVVFVSHNGDIQIAMSVEGITCAHCVKIVETVLKGCNGNKSPIEGLLDAAADRVLCKVLIRIDKSGSAKRVSFESVRNLAMVGYTAKPKSMSIVNAGGDKKATMDLGSLSTAFEVVASTDPKDVFDWKISCTCPDNGILRDDCARHSQMNTRIFEAFDSREKQVSDYMAGCGQKYGMACTCGQDCRCANCSEHCKTNKAQGGPILQLDKNLHEPLNFDQGMVVPTGPVNEPADFGMSIAEPLPIQQIQEHSALPSRGTAVRNRSFLQFPGRQMSITSETTFGRAMSGLSALSIDWENMEDFDVDVDHSAHINVGLPGLDSAMNTEPSPRVGGYRRSSFRRSSFKAMDSQSANNDDGNHTAHVSFKIQNSSLHQVSSEVKKDEDSFHQF